MVIPSTCLLPPRFINVYKGDGTGMDEQQSSKRSALGGTEMYCTVILPIALSISVADLVIIKSQD